jgi:hypothetical protein
MIYEEVTIESGNLLIIYQGCLKAAFIIGSLINLDLLKFYLIIILIIKLEFDKMIICISPKFDPLSVFSFPF